MSVEKLKSELREFLLKNSVRRGEFKLSSGATSDLYIDAKLTTLDPAMALVLGKIGWAMIQARTRSIEAIGGLTMGADSISLAIGIAAHLEGASQVPQVFTVRKNAKKHGLSKLIEGNFRAGATVVVIEDIITKGLSTLEAIDAVESAGGKVAFVLALVDRQEGGRANIEKNGHEVQSIFTRAELLGDVENQTQP